MTPKELKMTPEEISTMFDLIVKMDKVLREQGWRMKVNFSPIEVEPIVEIKSGQLPCVP